MLLRDGQNITDAVNSLKDKYVIITEGNIEEYNDIKLKYLIDNVIIQQPYLIENIIDVMSLMIKVLLVNYAVLSLVILTKDKNR